MKKETITCLNCGAEHTYMRTRKHKKHCSNKCAGDYRDRQPKTKAARISRNKAYYKKYPEKRIYVAIKASAKKRGLDFNVTEAWIKQRLQNAVCEVTGLPIRSNAGSVSGRRDYYSPSVDRIDNAIGYVQSNLRMVAWGVNLAKNKFSDRDLSAMSLSVVLSHLPKASQQNIVDLLPPQLLGCMPAGHGFSHLTGV